MGPASFPSPTRPGLARPGFIAVCFRDRLEAAGGRPKWAGEPFLLFREPTHPLMPLISVNVYDQTGASGRRAHRTVALAGGTTSEIVVPVGRKQLDRRATQTSALANDETYD